MLPGDVTARKATAGRPESPGIPAAGARRRPGRKRKESLWCQQHHVTDSYVNHAAPKSRRAYFDHLPAVTYKEGEFTDMLVASPPRYGEAVAHEEHIHKRYRQFPQFWKRGRWPAFLWGPAYATPGSLSSIEVGSPFWSKSATPSPGAANEEQEEEEDARPKPAKLDTSDLLEAISRLPNQTPEPRKEAPSPGGRASVAGAKPRSRRSMPHRSTCDSINATAAQRRSHLHADGSGGEHVDEQTRFLQWLKSKFGNATCLWRKLDADGSMVLHKSEFSQGLKNLRYPGDTDALWKIVDFDGTGTVSFIEVCPEAALDIARFRSWMEIHFGNSKALFARLDEDKSNSITAVEFKQGAIKLGLPGDISIENLFHLLDTDGRHAKGAGGSISEQELRFLDLWRPPAYLCEEPNFAAKEKFLDALLSRYHQNPFLAWRRCLDKDNSMRVSYDEFIIQCKALAKRGISEALPECGIAPLYVAFDTDRSGCFTLKDWDKETWESVRDFVLWCRREFGSLAKFLKAAEQAEVDDDSQVIHGGGVPCTKFTRTLKPLGWSHSKRLDLFEALQAPTKKMLGKAGHVSPADVVFLSNWNPDLEAEQDNKWAFMTNRKSTPSTPKRGTILRA